MHEMDCLNEAQLPKFSLFVWCGSFRSTDLTEDCLNEAQLPKFSLFVWCGSFRSTDSY